MCSVAHPSRWARRWEEGGAGGDRTAMDVAASTTGREHWVGAFATGGERSRPGGGGTCTGGDGWWCEWTWW